MKGERQRTVLEEKKGVGRTRKERRGEEDTEG